MGRASLLPVQVLALAASLAAPCALAAEASPSRYVIAIGYNAAEPDPRPTLSFADDDAARFFLQQVETSEKAWLLTTFDEGSAAAYPELTRIAAPPTRTELARALGEITWLARARKSEGTPTELVLYFAGHGDVTPAGEGYLVLADGRLTRTDLFQQVVQGSPTDVNHLLLDACASYFMVNSRGEERTSGQTALSPELLNAIRADVAQDDPAAWARTGVLVSTSSSAAVHETSALASGVFSYLLRSALAGAADLNRDGSIEYGEVAAFIASASAHIGDPRARLAVHAAAPAQRPHAALTDLTHPAYDRFLRIAGDDPRQLRLLDARGLPYAELHREPDQGVTLALVGGPYFVVQAGDREALLVPRSPGAYAVDALDFYDAPRPRGQGVPAELFLSSFGRAFAEGYFAASGHPVPLRGAQAFEPPWAEGGEPPFALTPTPFAWAALGVAGLSAVGSVLALGANLYAFALLQQAVVRSGTLDPALSFTVESTRLVAYSAGGLAVAAAAGAGGLFLWAWLREEDE